MNRTVSLIILLACGVLWAAATTLADSQANVGTLTGTVLSERGTPVSGATVTIETAEGSHPHATISDAHGHFAFIRFSPGQYNVRAYSKGHWSDWQRNVVIRRKKKAIVTLRLRSVSPAIEARSTPK